MSVVVALASGPTKIEADPILAQRNLLVVPDILANAGRVTVSYSEWSQNRAGFNWSLKKVQEKLPRIMQTEFNAIYETMDRIKTDMRTAAYAHALGRIGAALESQGTAEYFSGS